MRKFYMILGLVVAFATTSSAQALTACTSGDTVKVSFDYSQNCPASPGDLSGLTEIGVHSGANSWSTVIDWDNANATTAVNDGNDVFSYEVTYEYWGFAAPADLVDFYVVFNQGPADPNTPWGSEGKMDDGAGGCADFFVEIASLAACATSTEKVEFEGAVTIAPNPMTNRTALRFDNPNNEAFDMIITNLTGQVVRSQNNINTDFVNIERGELTAGVYFITLRNAKGATITEKLIVQ